MLLRFDTEIAALVGANGAVLFENLAFWVTENAKSGRNLRDGCAWTYDTVDAFAEKFPFLTPRTIRTALGKLARAGLIRCGCFNENPMDHTKWYTLTAKGRALYDQREQRNEPPASTQKPRSDKKTPVDATELPHRTDEKENPTIDSDEKRSDEKQPPADARDPAFSEVARSFSDNIHPIKGRIERDTLGELLADYGKDWTLAAIAEAAAAGGRSVRYLGAILARWHDEGFRTKKKGEPHHGQRTAAHPGARGGAPADDKGKWDGETSGWDG